MTLAVSGLEKSYGRVRALRGVDLTVERGTVHALLGPNGAGKSTLIACLSGAVAPDAGTIALDGRELRDLTPRAARAAGISVIYQRFSLVNALPVEDNVFLGEELTRWGLRRRRAQRAETRRLLARLRRDVPLGVPISALSVADRQLVEIAKALHHESRVIVFDEPTASLSRLEAEALAAQIRELRRAGLHILYVTHRLDEVLELADRVTVLRDGAVVTSRGVAGLSRGDLVAAVSGPLEPAESRRAAPAPGAPVLELGDVEADRIGPLSLTVGEGEIVGVFGALGSGRTELLETIYGLRRPVRGSLTLDGARLGPGRPQRRIAQGVVLVPADRIHQSLFMTLTAGENILLPSLLSIAVPGTRMRRRGEERRVFERTTARLRVRPADPAVTASTFSGGNQQKLVLGRWLNELRDPRLFLLDEPTQGIDVGTRAELYEILRRTVAERPCSVIFTSSEADEVVRLAHRAVVLDRGRVVAELAGDALEEATLLAYANAHPEPLGA